jgi:hypothetical protein
MGNTAQDGVVGLAGSLSWIYLKFTYCKVLGTGRCNIRNVGREGERQE